MIAVTSCVHLGHRDCRVDLFDRFLSAVVATKAKLVVIGDILECGGFIGTRHISSTWDQNLTPGEQFEVAIEKLRRVPKAQRLLMQSGNHEERVRKAVGLDLNKRLAAELDMPYAPTSALLRVDGRRMFFAHGCARSDFDQVLKGYGALDVVALGHTHELSQAVVRRCDGRRRSERRDVHLVRCGTFLEEPRYAKSALLPPNPLGAAWIQVKGERVFVDLGVTPRDYNG